ncbi:hypothetical protein DE146DRAFT_602989 [Phaeosphaeria sp. MPI-PUGE-AT-0046c]|nr:hypothetical protein DE146DRAFT_602989 [Phaeosphaeria sp. MPI-PUGE-AT-0046c]
MSPLHSLFTIWLASCTAAAAFHRRGSANDSGRINPLSSVASIVDLPVASAPSITDQSTKNIVASFSSNILDARPTLAESTRSPEVTIKANITTTVPDLTANSTVLSLDTGSNVTSLEPTRVSNASCTINIPSASIDYWYPATYSHAVGTITSIAENFTQSESYTLVPATATFDVASALESNFACTMSESPLPDLSWTYTFCIGYSDKPTAAVTSLAHRTGFAPFPTGGVIPISEVMKYDIYIDLPLATHTISIGPNQTLEQVSATPYVHFTAYEIESGNRTETVQLPSALAYPYEAKDLQHDASATGSLPTEFMQQIPRADCDAGQLVASVTVLIVVDLYYENLPAMDPFLIHFESSVFGFNDPEVNINNENGDTRGVPITMGDWDLPGETPKATPAPGITDNGPGAVPTARPGTNTNNNNNNAQHGAGSNEGQQPKMPQPTEVTVGTIGTVPVVIGPSSVVVIGSQTLQPGGPAVIVGGVTPVSLVPSATALVVGGSTTLQLPQVSNDPVPPPLLTIGSSTLTPNAATQFFIAPGQTLTPGGTATVDGTLVSLAPAASFVVVGGTTQFLPAAAPVAGTFTNPPQIIVGGATITALPVQGNPNNNQNNVQNNAVQGPTFVIEGQTLAPGGQAITVGGNTLSLLPGGSSVVVNGATSAVSNPSAQVSPPQIAIGNEVFTASPGGTTFVIGDQTLSAGGQAITVSGTVVSLAPSASFVVINGVTSAVANPAAARVTTASQPITTNPPLLIVGSSTITAISGTTYVIGGQTLTPGGTITVDGTTIVLAPGATQLVYGSSGRSTTSALFPATTTRAQNISGASTATAQASGGNGQAVATSKPTGSASLTNVDSGLLSFFLVILGLSLY